MKRNSRPSLNPQKIDDDSWYYEYRGRIEVVHEIRDSATGNYIRTDTIKIPWRKLEKSMKRCRG